ncbi:MAG: phosphoglucosamine mutase, partial [Rubritepida sp.]|nr:phosphoglucosamine mutase [Rubritepida sp.]
DQILALIASSWAQQGRLKGDALVATVMSNMGLERYMKAKGLALHRTNVGDRYVSERMRETGCNVGGEQSGHVILTDFGTTGDGLVAALQVLAVLVEQKRPASEVCRQFETLPQRLVNIRFTGVSPLKDAGVQSVIAAEEKALGEAGRVLIRASGTEPVIRVMVEAEEEGRLNQVLDSLCGTIRSKVSA